MDRPGIKPGDLVRLRPDGPLMRVTAVFRSVLVCIWFNRNGWIQHGSVSSADVEVDRLRDDRRLSGPG